jgi:cellobiose phosphorylase
LARIAEMLPWYTHNALVHYLSPRGLEQYSGGGWGTRDVCQGPVEMLLALGHLPPIRDILLRLMRMQNADGDWPQWFMFFERERDIRAGDSHGDIVFWPLLVLAQYLLASGDAGVLDERCRSSIRAACGWGDRDAMAARAACAGADRTARHRRHRAACLRSRRLE